MTIVYRAPTPAAPEPIDRYVPHTPCPCGALYIGQKRGLVWDSFDAWHKQHRNEEDE